MAARKTFWLDKQFSITAAANSQNANVLTSTLTVQERRGLTLVRMIYRIWTTPVDALDTHTQQLVWFGVGLIESDAVTAGTFPDVDIEGDAPGRGWVIRDVVANQSGAGTSGVSIYGELRGDIRAMRVIHQTEELVAIFDTADFAGTAQSTRIRGQCRLLFKLP